MHQRLGGGMPAEKMAIHACRRRAQEYSSACEVSLDDLEVGLTGQCHRCGTRRLCGGEHLVVEERPHAGRGKAGKLRRMRESDGGGVVDSRHMSNNLSELRDVTQMPQLGGPRSRKPVQGVAEKLVVCKDEKLGAFQHQAKWQWWSRQLTTPCRRCCSRSQLATASSRRRSQRRTTKVLQDSADVSA